MTTLKTRQNVERKIAKRTIEVLIAAGFSISVDDGEEIVLERSVDKTAILAAMFSTDEDVLRLTRVADQTPSGFVLFVYGNDGYDVICDHSVSLEEVLAPVATYAETFEPK